MLIIRSNNTDPGTKTDSATPISASDNDDYPLSEEILFW